MSADENKAIVRQVIEEVMSHGKVDMLDNLMARTFVTTPLWPNPRKPSTMTGISDFEAFKKGVAMIHAALPDVTVSIEAMTAEGDIVMTCTTTRGTHTGGAFFDIPATGKKVQWTTFAFYRIEGGKIVADRWLWDRLGAWQQLGVLPDQDALTQQRHQAKA